MAPGKGCRNLHGAAVVFSPSGTTPTREFPKQFCCGADRGERLSEKSSVHEGLSAYPRQNFNESNNFPWWIAPLTVPHSPPGLVGRAIANYCSDSELALVLVSTSGFLGPRAQQPRASAAARSHEISNTPGHLPCWLFGLRLRHVGSIGILGSNSETLPDDTSNRAA
jgi:hypothetical protein